MKLFGYDIMNLNSISGTSVPVRDGSTRVFIRNKNENIKYRNNTLYDLCMTKLSQVTNTSL